MKGPDSGKQDLIQESLYKISKAVIDTVALPELYKTIHMTIKELMPSENFYIALYNEDDGMVHFPYYIDQYDPPPLPRKFGKGLTEFVIQSKEPLLLNDDVERKLNFSNVDFEVYGSPSQIWLGIPLKMNDKVLGAMVVQDYNSKFAYSEEHKNVLSFVSEQAALAINKKRDEEALKKYMGELEIHKKLLEDRAKELSLLNKNLAESQANLQRVNANKDKLFSIVSHDLRSPFASLLGFLDYVTADYENLTDEERKNYLAEVASSAKNIFNLLENLLKWAQLQMGNLEIQPVYIDMYDIINRTVEIMRANSLKKQVAIKSEAVPGSVVFADQNMINSVMLNLVSNAIKFTRKGDAITIITKNYDERVEVVVEDTGIGINREDLDKIFKIGIRHSTKGTNNESGTGLGLSLSKDLIEKNGGTLSAYSDGIKGARFTFSLPKKSAK
ncbi:MAG TPA: GAF domain-containing sensor histidine kinase [Ignavibacteriales bacterium]|nr:GAF domain-containing sensor histidine kinase [Ignavibacteriales bacterium]